MATYRHGKWITFWEDSYYVIQKKVLGIWVTQSKYSDRNNMINAVERLIKTGHTVL